MNKREQLIVKNAANLLGTCSHTGHDEKVAIVFLRQLAGFELSPWEQEIVDANPDLFPVKPVMTPDEFYSKYRDYDWEYTPAAMAYESMLRELSGIVNAAGLTDQFELALEVLERSFMRWRYPQKNADLFCALQSDTCSLEEFAASLGVGSDVVGLRERYENYQELVCIALDFSPSELLKLAEDAESRAGGFELTE